MKAFIHSFSKAIIPLLIICCSLNTPVKAAFPIKTVQTSLIDSAQISKNSVQNYNENKLPQQKLSPEERRQSGRESGVYGIMSFVFALFGWFPLAIIFGIIGVQPQRRNKDIATIGLVLGLAEFALFAIIILILIGAFPWI